MKSDKTFDLELEEFLDEVVSSKNSRTKLDMSSPRERFKRFLLDLTEIRRINKELEDVERMQKDVEKVLVDYEAKGWDTSNLDQGWAELEQLRLALLIDRSELETETYKIQLMDFYVD